MTTDDYPSDDVRETLIDLRLRVRAVETQIEALGALTEAKFVTFRTLIESQADKVALALAAADKAVTKAEIANEKRFDGVNEFRSQLNDQARTFLTRNEAEQALMGAQHERDALKQRIDKLETKADRAAGRTEGLGAGWSILIGAVGLVVAILTIVGIIIGTRP